jgi:hypothetical protein
MDKLEANEMNHRVINGLHQAYSQVRSLGLYLAMALLLPGGSLLALLLWLNQRRQGKH